MASNPTLSRYLTREVAQYTSLGFLAAAPVVLFPNLFDRADEFLVAGLTASDQLDIALCVVPLIVTYALPMAFLFGLLMAIGRLSADFEIGALRSCGVGPLSILAPVLLLGAGVSALTAFLMIDVEPRAKRELIALSLRVAARGSLIEEGRFQGFGRRTIFVSRHLGDRRLEGVMIADASHDRKLQIFAEAGRFDYDYESGFLELSLQNGDMRMEPRPSDDFEEYRISFTEFDYRFHALELGVGRLRYQTDQLDLAELREAVRRIESGNYERDLKYREARVYATQIHRVLSVPFSSALFALVGVPLGLRGLVRSRAWGMLLGLTLLSSYYGLFAYLQTLAREGQLPPPLAIWTPNALLVLAGAALLWSGRRLR